MRSSPVVAKTNVGPKPGQHLHRFYWNPCVLKKQNENGLDLILPSLSLRLKQIKSSINVTALDAHLTNGITQPEGAIKLNQDERQLLLELVERGFVVHTTPEDHSSDDPTLKYLFATRTHTANGLSLLRQSTPTVLGLGGVGSCVLQHLVGMGIKNYILLDADTVEETNLNRQHIYSRRHIGQSKTRCAHEYIDERIKGATVRSYQKRIMSLRDLTDLDIPKASIIINCLDEPQATIERIVYKYARAKKIAAISAGVGTNDGYWGPLIIPSTSPSPNNFDKNQKHYERNSQPHPDANIIPWSFGPTNTLVSTLLVKDVISWLASASPQHSLNRRTYINFNTLQITSEDQ